jgi:outer membrane protein TolC
MHRVARTVLVGALSCVLPFAVAHAQAPAPAGSAAASTSASAGTTSSASSATTTTSTATTTPPPDDKKAPTSLGAVYDLRACLALADSNNAQIRMAMDRLAQAHAQLDEIKWVPWSQFSVSGGVAAVPEIKGTGVYSPNGDISLSSKLGPAWRIGVEGVIPLWTFGKISAANEAADKLVEVAAADVERWRSLVHHDVRRAYFGLMLAHDARYLIDTATGKLDSAISTIEDKDDADEADVLRMKTLRAEIKARYGEIEKGERIATAALRFLTGVQEPAAFDVPDEPIKPPKKPLLDVVVYLGSAKVNRPELKMVRAGIEGRRAQLDLAKARLYPDIGLGLSIGYSNAPYIADQTNPFVLDNANYLRYGFGIVFKWNLDLLPAAARVHYAEAQLAELSDTQTFAMGGVGVEVQTAYGTVKDAQIREQEYGEAEQLAKRWVATVTAAISIGTKDDKELVDPLRYYLTDRYNHLQAIMDLDVAYSSLSLATGDDTIAEY